MSNDDKIYFSGAIGLVILKNNNNKIFIFYDDHSNKKYCNNTKLFLNSLFDVIIYLSDNTVLLLEEPFIKSNSNIKYLWDDVVHVKKINKYYKKIINKCATENICYTFPVDIRLCLIDISYDELINNINTKDYFNDLNIKVIDYFKYLLFLFDVMKIDIDENKNNYIIFIKKIFSFHKNNKHYKKLCKSFYNLYYKFIVPNKNLYIKEFINKYKNTNFNYTKGFPFNENDDDDDFHNKYDKIIDGIMELYTIILLLCFNKSCVIIYCGYFHSNNIEYILTNYYNYKNVYSNGKTDNIDLAKINNISSCIYVDKKNLI